MCLYFISFKHAEQLSCPVKIPTSYTSNILLLYRLTPSMIIKTESTKTKTLSGFKAADDFQHQFFIKSVKPVITPVSGVRQSLRDYTPESHHSEQLRSVLQHKHLFTHRNVFGN